MGTGKGVYFSSDNGKFWIPINEGLTEFDIICLTASNDYIFIHPFVFFQLVQLSCIY